MKTFRIHFFQCIIAKSLLNEFSQKMLENYKIFKFEISYDCHNINNLYYHNMKNSYYHNIKNSVLPLKHTFIFTYYITHLVSSTWKTNVLRVCISL